MQKVKKDLGKTTADSKQKDKFKPGFLYLIWYFQSLPRSYDESKQKHIFDTMKMLNGLAVPPEMSVVERYLKDNFERWKWIESLSTVHKIGYMKGCDEIQFRHR